MMAITTMYDKGLLRQAFVVIWMNLLETKSDRKINRHLLEIRKIAAAL